MGQVNFDSHGLTFRERRRFRVWGMDKTVPVKPADVFEKAPQGRLEVSGPQFDSPMPVFNREDLAELAFFCTGQGTVADLPTAQALKTLQELGWTFQQEDQKVGAYGAYNRLGEEGLVAVREGIEEPLSEGESLQKWAGIAGASPVAAKAGFSAYLLTEDVSEPEIVQKLVEEGRYQAAATLIPTQDATADLPPKIRALVAMAQEEHPENFTALAAELFSHELSSWEKEKVGDALLRLAPAEEPVTRIMSDLWKDLPVPEARGLLAEVVWPHLGTDSPEELRKVGLEAMASMGGYYVQRAIIGQVFSQHVGPSDRRWALELAEGLFAHQSRTSLYRGCLTDGTFDDAQVFAQALAEISYNEDGAKVGRAALRRLQTEPSALADEMIDDRTYATYVQALALAAVRCGEREGDGALQTFAHEGLRALVEADQRDYHREIDFARQMARKLSHTELGKIGVELAALEPDNYSRPGVMMREMFARPLTAPVDSKLVRSLAEHYPGSSGKPVLGALSVHSETVKKCLVAGSVIADLSDLAAAMELVHEVDHGAIDVKQGQDWVQVGDFDLDVKR